MHDSEPFDRAAFVARCIASGADDEIAETIADDEEAQRHATLAIAARIMGHAAELRRAEE